MRISDVSDEAIDKAMNKLEDWVDKHSAPDDFVVVSGTKGWTPRNILETLKEKRAKGKWKDDLPETILLALIKKDKSLD